MQNRRKFLKNTIFTITGAGLAPKVLPGTAINPRQKEKARNLYTGNNQIMLSEALKDRPRDSFIKMTSVR